MSAFDIASSGMAAQRIRMNVIANNLANVNTTRTEEGTPYRRRSPIFETADGGFASLLERTMEGKGGVQVSEIIEDTSDRAFVQLHDPHHPDADENGMVLRPNINPVTEMVNLMAATRAFEANVTVFNSTKRIGAKALEIGT